MGWLIVVLVIIAVAALWAVLAYNGLVRRKNMVAEAWGGIDAQLKRRADLIPNLVEAVKGYVAHERNTFDELAQLRAAAQAQPGMAARAQTETAIAAALMHLVGVAEAYPELKASENFRQLQSELADTEDQIQLARRYYNGTVRNYNIMIGQFPSNLIANLGKFAPAPFFQIENDSDRQVPDATFAA